jgi:phosphatidylinositol glycan class F
MSSTKGQLASAVDTKTKAPVQPISILDTPAASAISLARPIVLVGLLALRFNALISDPVSTLQTALPVVAAIQVSYALLCLPALGSHHVKGARKTRPGERKKAADTSGPNSVFVRWFLSKLGTGMIQNRSANEWSFPSF